MEQACQARDLLEGQDLVPVQELVIRAKDLLRHAIDAAEVAAVCNGDPQIAQGAVESIVKGHHFLVQAHIMPPVTSHTARAGV